MKRTVLTFTIFIYLSGINLVFAQAQANLPVSQAGDTLILTLQQVIDIAKGQAPASKQASTLLKNSYWQFRTYRAGYLPSLMLDATIPNFNHSINPITQPDGSVFFVKQEVANSILNLSLNQNIEWTGGSVLVGSTLNKINLYGSNASENYSSTPVFVGLSQPFLKFNSYKWDHLIQPVRYEESKRGYAEQMEDVSMTASNLFFDLLLAQVNVQIAETNLENNDTLYNISVGRFNLGKIAENDLLQMQMGVMNAKSNVAQGRLDMQLGMIRLRNYLNIKGEQPIRLIVPEHIPFFNVDFARALAEAKNNRSEMLSYERQKLEARRDVALAKGSSGFSADLYASYGLAQAGEKLNDTYLNPLVSEQVRFGIAVPILDWGKRYSQVQTAKANQQLTELNLQVAEQNFDQEILLAVNRIELIREKVKIALQSDTIAEKRNDITMKRYLIGKIDILDLNVARDARVQAKRDYIQSLRDFWNVYYDLRKKTLFDFERNEKIK